MKLTKSLIKNLIREELSKLQEQGDPEALAAEHAEVQAKLDRCWAAVGDDMSNPRSDECVSLSNKLEEIHRRLHLAKSAAKRQGKTIADVGKHGGGLKHTPAAAHAVDKCNQLHANDSKALEDCLLKIKGMTPKVEKDEATAKTRRAGEKEVSKSPPRSAEPSKEPEQTPRQKKRARMRKAGVRALKAAGWEGRTAKEIYGNFYAAVENYSSEENNIKQILGKEDMLWGKNHAKALLALTKELDKEDKKEWEESDEGKAHSAGEEKKKAEAEELKSLRSEKTARISKENAEQLYDVLEGWSTDEEGDAKKIRSILIKVYDQNNPKKWPNGDEVGAVNIEALSSMFDEVTKEREHRAMGDNLAQWLRDDGHDGIADAVDKLISKANEASKYVPPEEAEEGDYEGRKERLGLKGTDLGGDLNLQENAVYSSFPNQQKLHEGWNRYLKRNQII